MFHSDDTAKEDLIKSGVDHPTDEQVSDWLELMCGDKQTLIKSFDSSYSSYSKPLGGLNSEYILDFSVQTEYIEKGDSYHLYLEKNTGCLCFSKGEDLQVFHLYDRDELPENNELISVKSYDHPVSALEILKDTVIAIRNYNLNQEDEYSQIDVEQGNGEFDYGVYEAIDDGEDIYRSDEASEWFNTESDARDYCEKKGLELGKDAEIGVHYKESGDIDDYIGEIDFEALNEEKLIEEIEEEDYTPHRRM